MRFKSVIPKSDPRIRIRIKMKRIRNTVLKNCLCLQLNSLLETNCLQNFRTSVKQ